MSRQRIDSFSRLERPPTPEEKEWLELIRSKAPGWNRMRDSLQVPFRKIRLSDTVVVLLGLFGTDDGFTYKERTVCLDLTALCRAYGKASSAENDERIDRIFAHEYTHLLHKGWAKEKSYVPKTYKDSILWESFYEGVGMFRSLNRKWLPAGDSLPTATLDALRRLQREFVANMVLVGSDTKLDHREKEKIKKNLSRGKVEQKWGAFPVSIWLAIEEKKHKNLGYWIEKGPEAVIELAKKYLPDGERKALGRAY